MLQTHLLETDSYDREIAARMLGAMSGLDELVSRGERLVPHFRSLLDDLFFALFKLSVRIRPPEACPASTLLARRILLGALSGEGFTALKEETALDASRSAHAAVLLARRALALIRTGEIFLEEELLTARELAEEEDALERNRAAAEELADEAGEIGEALKRLVEAGEKRTEALKEALEQALEEVPPRFERDLAATSERLADDVPNAEEQAEAFSRATSGQGPRSATERLRLAEKLTANQKLKKLAQLAGAFRSDARAARRKRRERATTEVFRVGRGATLGRLLPSELASLRHPLRRRDFLRRVIEQQLLQYDLRGDDRAGRGPVVVCLDGSGSMSGPRELWSKAVTLALLEIARKQGRRTRALVFSGPEAPLADFELTARGRMTQRRAANLDEIVKLAECFPGGGTDFEKPLRAALDAIRSSGMKGADIVFITDGEAHVPDAFAEELRAEKKRRDISIYAVLVDDVSRNTVKDHRINERAARELGKVADEMTTVSRLTSESVKDIFRAI